MGTSLRKIHPAFLLGALTISAMPKPKNVPDLIADTIVPSLLQAANEMLPRPARITSAFNYFLCVGGIYKYMDEVEGMILRDVGEELFKSIDITTEEFDALEDRGIENLPSPLSEKERAMLASETIEQIRHFRNVVKRLMQDGKGTADECSQTGEINEG